MEQLLAAVNKYDPAYTQKVKVAVETIDEEFACEELFTTALTIEFDGAVQLLSKLYELFTSGGQRSRCVH